MDLSNRGSWSRRSAKRLGRVVLVALMIGACSAAAWAGGPTEGVDELGVRNLVAKTVEIGAHTYRVTGRTIMLDEEGNTLTLAQLPVPNHDSAPNLRPVVTGRFSATEVAGNLTLIRLELVETPH